MQTLADNAEAQIDLNDNQVAAISAAASVGGAADRPGTDASLRALLSQLESNATPLANALAGADVDFNNAVLTATNTWQIGILNRSKDYAESVFDEGLAYGDALHAAGDQFEADLVHAYDQFVSDVNPILDQVHTDIQAKHDAYLNAIRSKKAEVEDELEAILDGNRDDMLDVLQVYYQRRAQFVEETIDEGTMKTAVKTAVLALIDVKEATSDAVDVTLNEFVDGEQAAMVAMATGVAQFTNTALEQVADKVKLYHDTIAHDEKTALDSVVDAMNAYDLNTTDERETFANQFTQIDDDYRLSIYNAAVDHQTAALGSVKTYASGVVTEVSQWLTDQGYSADATKISNAGPVLDAHLGRNIANLGIEKSYLGHATTEEVGKAARDHAAEAAYADAAVDKVATANKNVNGHFHDYAGTINQLSRDWVSDANSEDINVIAKIAGSLRDENLDAQPDGTGDNTAGAQYRAQLDAIPPDAWPVTLGVPQAPALGVSHMNFLADPELPGGVIDITRAEYEFAGSDEAEIIDNDPEPHLEEADGNDFIGAVQTEPGSVETTERYSAGDVITDANGVEVGVVVARADGSLWVRRDEVRAGVLPSDPDYPEGYGDFDYFLPIAAVVIELEAIELTGTFQGPYYDWDSFARNVGESEEYDWAAEQGWAAAQTRAAQRDLYESLSEATPDWLGSILVAQAGGTGDQIINSVDQFFAGMSSTVTGGLTNKVRAAIYGEIATQNHEGKFYTAGQIAGIAPAIAVGVMGGATVAHTGALVQFARTATAVQTAQGFYETGVKVLEGQPLSWTDALNLAPAATAGAGPAHQSLDVSA